MHSFRFATRGTCSQEIVVMLEGDVVRGVEFVGGCQGNLQGISALVRGRHVNELVPMLRGIQCQNGTSCPDQLSQALQQAIAVYRV